MPNESLKLHPFTTPCAGDCSTLAPVSAQTLQRHTAAELESAPALGAQENHPPAATNSTAAGWTQTAQQLPRLLFTPFQIPLNQRNSKEKLVARCVKQTWDVSTAKQGGQELSLHKICCFQPIRYHFLLFPSNKGRGRGLIPFFRKLAGM